MRIPVLMEINKAGAACMVLSLLMAAAAGFQLACSYLAGMQLRDARNVLRDAAVDRGLAADERVATRTARDRVEAMLAKAQVILDNAAEEQRRQSRRLEGGGDAAEMPWL